MPEQGADQPNPNTNGGILHRLLAPIAHSDWYLIFLGAFIGTITALGAIAFKYTLDITSEQGFGLIAQLPLWALPILPMTGALATAIIVKNFAPEAKGHGVPEVIDAMHHKSGVIRPRVALAKAVASVTTIGSGGSAGAEGPIVQIGSAIGSALARLIRVHPDQIPTLLGCGAAAGIASVFNAPIAGVFFVLEIILKDFTAKTFTPVMVASVFSAATTQAILDENEAIFAVGEKLRGYEFTFPELPSYLLLGLVCGTVAVAFVKTLYATEDAFAALKLRGREVPSIVKPVIGAALLGVLGITYILIAPSTDPDNPTTFTDAHTATHNPATDPTIGEDSTPVPNFFGNGYETIRALLLPETFGPEENTPPQPRPEPNPEPNPSPLQANAPVSTTDGSPVERAFVEAEQHIAVHTPVPSELWLIALLVAFKAAATALTLGSGGSGGVFAPSLFLGACAGACVGITLDALGLIPVGGSPAAYALVGMAAVVAATTHAPLTAILVLFELTNDYKVILPIMFAAVLALSVARLMLRDSIYTLKLRRRGIEIGSAIDHTLLRKLKARHISPVPHVSVRPVEPLSKLLELRDAYRIADFVVIDADNAYIGIVTAQDVRTALIEREAIPYLLIAELVREDLPVVTPDEPLDSVLRKFSTFDVSSLALVETAPDGTPGTKVLGLITRGRLMQRYNEALRER